MKEHLALEYQVGKLLANRYGIYELENLKVPDYCRDVIDVAIGERMFHMEVWEWWNSLYIERETREKPLQARTTLVVDKKKRRLYEFDGIADD